MRELPADLEALRTALTQCDALYGNAGRTEEFGNLLHFAFCDASATLHDSLIEPVQPADHTPGAGPEGDPDSCD